MKKKVVLRGPFLTSSGYGVHSRQIARHFISRDDVDVKVIATPWGQTPWIVDSESHNGLIKEIMIRTINPIDVKGFDLSVQLQLPNEWDPNLAATNIGMSAIVETDRCNPDWIRNINSMSHVIVPSNFTKNVVVSTSKSLNIPLITNIEVIPESYIDSCTHEPIDISRGFTPKRPFNFLVFGQLTGNNTFNDRKNIFITLKWLTEAFTGNENVGIIVKTNSGKNTKIDRHVTLNTLKSVVKEIRGNKTNCPPIQVLHGDMTDDEVVSLYKNDSVKALVSLTRGEGFGLPILEAAVCGLPVIATDWSGHLDFMNLGKFMKIGYNIVDVHKTKIDNNIFVKGCRWADPSEIDFKAKVKKFFVKPDVPRQWAKDLSITLTKTHNFVEIDKKYYEAFKCFL